MPATHVAVGYIVGFPFWNPQTFDMSIWTSQKSSLSDSDTINSPKYPLNMSGSVA